MSKNKYDKIYPRRLLALLLRDLNKWRFVQSYELEDSIL